MNQMQSYLGMILSQLSDPVPRVRRTVAWVIYRLAECNTQMVF